MRDRVDRKTAPFGSQSFMATSVGIGFAIAATEATRYCAVWSASTERATVPRIVLIVLLAAILAAFLAIGHFAKKPVHEWRSISLGMGVLCMVGVVLKCVAEASGAFDSGMMVLSGVLMELSYPMLVLYASFALSRDVRFAAKTFAAGLSIAGLIQIVTATIPQVVAWAIVLVLPLVAGGALGIANAAVEKETSWYIALAPDAQRALSEPRVQSGSAGEVDGMQGLLARRGSRIASLTVLGCIIVLTSFVIAYIHSRWSLVHGDLGIAQGVQLSAGIGTILVAGVIWLCERRFQQQTFFDLFFFVVVPVALLGVYLSMLPGQALLLSLIPLNGAYALLLFYIWLFPIVHDIGLHAHDMSLFMLLIKRTGVLAALPIISWLDAMESGAMWAAIVNIAVITVLIILSCVFFVRLHPGFLQVLRRAEQVPATVGDPVVEACDGLANTCGLTPREHDVIELLARGRTASFISSTLGISEATVRTHIMHIYQKLGINSQQKLLDRVEEAKR